MDTKSFLELLSNSNAVSGYEHNLQKIITSAFEKYSDQIKIDKLGNIMVLKKGKNNINNIKIMIAAHMDEIGFMVKDIEENGFIKFTPIGGIDSRTILGQEVIVHGSKDIFGVIGSKPPHLQEDSNQNQAIKIEDMSIDVGYSKEEINKIVSIGDIITVKREFLNLENNKVSGKALDNRTGIVAMYLCIKELNKINHEADIYFTSTVQEEVSMAGALTSSYKINPDIGIAVDVGFGRTPELSMSDSIELGKGPGITLGGNIHQGLRKHIIRIAHKYNISSQMEVTPGATGTDARAMQITREGIPSLVLSIPLRYMHTSVELVDLTDIEKTAQLLTFFIASISKENLGGILCYLKN